MGPLEKLEIKDGKFPENVPVVGLETITFSLLFRRPIEAKELNDTHIERITLNKVIEAAPPSANSYYVGKPEILNFPTWLCDCKLGTDAYILRPVIYFS